MQTSRQVVDSLLRGQKAERVALMEGPWSDTIAAWVQQGYHATGVQEKRPGSLVAGRWSLGGI
jgi:hypothetical protein